MSKSKLLITSASSAVLICYFVWAGIVRPSNPTTSPERFEADQSFKGRIVVTIIERKTGPEKKLEFLIDLDRGEISASQNAQFQDRFGPGGRIDDCRHQGPVEVLAPDHALIADCTVYNSITIVNKRSNELIRQWSDGQNWTICGLAWSVDSKSVAILLEEERMDLGPLGLISGASGHPIPLETFKVTVISAQSKSQLRLPVIRRDSPSGWARIKWTQ